MASSRTNLENLARAKQLNAEPPDEREMANLVAGAEAQLRASGYRPSSAGHRRILFQVLDATCGAPRELWMALDLKCLKRPGA
jgi:hypothetical protein